MSKCTYVYCADTAEHDQVAKTGEVWARLCRFHHQHLEAAINSGDPKWLLAAWVKAQGGSKVAVARTLGRAVK